MTSRMAHFGGSAVLDGGLAVHWDPLQSCLAPTLPTSLHRFLLSQGASQPCLHDTSHPSQT